MSVARSGQWKWIGWGISLSTFSTSTFSTSTFSTSTSSWTELGNEESENVCCKERPVEVDWLGHFHVFHFHFFHFHSFLNLEAKTEGQW